MKSIALRLAAGDDVPAILEISNRAAIETAANFAVEPEPLGVWESAFDSTSATHPWLVADDDGVIAGFAKGSPWKGRCAYDFAVETTIYLRPSHHGRGLGRALYERLLAMVAWQGYRTALGGIALPNDASVALHERCGMVHVGTFHAIGWKFEQWHDVGYWQRVFGGGAPGPLRSVRDAWNATR